MAAPMPSGPRAIRDAQEHAESLGQRGILAQTGSSTGMNWESIYVGRPSATVLPVSAKSEERGSSGRGDFFPHPSTITSAIVLGDAHRSVFGAEASQQHTGSIGHLAHCGCMMRDSPGGLPGGRSRMAGR